MKNHNKSIFLRAPLLLIAAAAVLSSAPVLHAQTEGNSANLTDTRGNVVRNATYLCWHTGNWTPAAAIAECDPDLVAKPAPEAAGPVADHKTRAGRAKNRRVEVEVIGTPR